MSSGTKYRNIYKDFCSFPDLAAANFAVKLFKDNVLRSSLCPFHAKEWELELLTEDTDGDCAFVVIVANSRVRAAMVSNMIRMLGVGAIYHDDLGRK